MRKYIFIILLLAITAALCAACASQGAVAPAPRAVNEKISVVTTIFPLYDFARAVAGDQAELTMLLKPGAETHSYEPSPADIIKIQNAGMFLYIGGESDVWVDWILDSMDGSDKTVLRLMDSVRAVDEEPVEGMEGAEEGGAALDEHIWTSPPNAILMVEAIAQALAELDPVHAEEYRGNAADYCAKISELDGEFRNIVAVAQRRLLVFGDRFPLRYFADEYGLTYRAAFPGCSTDADASAATLAYLMNIVSENDLPYVYYIELSNENIARAICEQTGAEALLFHSCQKISRGDFEAGLTYVDLMRQNVQVLRKGLN